MADPIFQAQLIHTFSAERPTRTVLADYQQVTDYADPHIINQKCRFDPQAEILADSQVGYLLEADWKMYCEPCNLRVLDRITWVAWDGTKKLIVKQVQAFYEEDGSIPHHLEVWVADQEALTGA